jgi:predicted RNA methylase
MENDAAKYAMDEHRGRFNALAGRHEAGTAPLAVAAFQLFQTPPEVAAQLAAALNLQLSARILEPSAGLGRLLDALKPYQPREVVAVESAPQCAAELYRQNRERVTLKQADFLTVFPDELGLFDAVIMNPPFHLRADVRHIEHALTFLRPGGCLAALCMAGPHREARLRPEALEWRPLPALSFSREGTRIDVVLAVFKNQTQPIGDYP